MSGDKYEKYGRPIPPADPNQEYMTVQETAHVLSVSVSWLRRFLKEHPKMHSRLGRRIVTDRAARAAIYDAKRLGGTAHRGSRRRPVRRSATSGRTAPLKSAA
ncbi:helix-turn-helix domain-containing protein [Streptomyces sp. B27]|uniref:helix-turn-helix domain-containing protein n=1 Tax=Streptomyces sp. B27 TaxID=2485015 RepID=UPI001F0B75FB|nr:helix-turn-helix domain-containing protein [Streptomyces sp. B27]